MMLAPDVPDGNSSEKSRKLLIWWPSQYSKKQGGTNPFSLAEEQL